MATRIRVVAEYCPRIPANKPVELPELARYLADRTGLHPSQVRYVLDELHAGALNFTRTGRKVRLAGLGTFSPTIDLDGTINVNHRLDQSLRVALNTPGVYEGDIVNRQNIGKSMDDLTTLWNESHPLDPIS